MFEKKKAHRFVSTHQIPKKYREAAARLICPERKREECQSQIQMVGKRLNVKSCHQNRKWQTTWAKDLLQDSRKILDTARQGAATMKDSLHILGVLG
jgi:hypothetical protein